MEIGWLREKLRHFPSSSLLELRGDQYQGHYFEVIPPEVWMKDHDNDVSLLPCLRIPETGNLEWENGQ